MPLVNVLVTGATGFLGSEILRALVDTREFVITALDIKPPSLDVEVFPTVQYLRCNVLDLEELRRVFNEVRPTVVVHTVAAVPRVATRYSGKNNDNIFKVNVEGTNNVIDASKESGVHALVYTSSVTVLFDELEKDFRNADETWSTGKATTAYGQSKVWSIPLLIDIIAGRGALWDTVNLKNVSLTDYRLRQKALFCRLIHLRSEAAPYVRPQYLDPMILLQFPSYMGASLTVRLLSFWGTVQIFKTMCMYATLQMRTSLQFVICLVLEAQQAKHSS